MHANHRQKFNTELYGIVHAVQFSVKILTMISMHRNVMLLSSIIESKAHTHVNYSLSLIFSNNIVQELLQT